MKRNSFLLMAAMFLCAGCSWNYDGTEEMRAYYFTYTDSTDIISTTDYARQQDTDDAIRESYLQVEGKLLVNGGTSADISDTYVTVKEIIVNLWIDGKDSLVTIRPAIHEGVAEPSELGGWDMMPEGVGYDRRVLCEELIPFVYESSFRAEVTVCYILRVSDTMLVTNSSADQCWKTVKFNSIGLRGAGEVINIVVPLNLVTMTFNAAIGE